MVDWFPVSASALIQDSKCIFNYEDKLDGSLKKTKHTQICCTYVLDILFELLLFCSTILIGPVHIYAHVLKCLPLQYGKLVEHRAEQLIKLSN